MCYKSCRLYNRITNKCLGLKELYCLKEGRCRFFITQKDYNVKYKKRTERLKDLGYDRNIVRGVCYERK